MGTVAIGHPRLGHQAHGPLTQLVGVLPGGSHRGGLLPRAQL